MRHFKPIELLAWAVLLGCALTTGLVLRKTVPRPDASLHSSIGIALAKEAIALLVPGSQVALITRDTESFPQPALDILVRSFRQELDRVHVPITSTQLIQTDPLRPVEVPSGDFYELIRRAAPGQVIVSLLGPPLLTEEQRNKLGPIRARIVAFCPGSLADTVDLRQLFQAGLLQAAVVSRPFPATEGPARMPSPKTFDDLYRTLRSKDIASGSAVSLVTP